MTRYIVPMTAWALLSAGASAQSNIDPAQKFAWQENVGWTNWRDAGDGAQGVEVLSDHIAGFIWCENIGFINVGRSGPYAPATSQTGSDFGVNVAPDGSLSGYAWGENVGWITFDTSTLGANAARYDDSTDRFRGYAWGENIGWLNLDDAMHFVATIPDCRADLDGDRTVGSGDLAIVLAAWNASGGPADLDASGTVGSGDLAIVLAAWGACD